MKDRWLDHIDAIIQSHCVGGVFMYSENERTDAAVKALNSTATALIDIATYLRIVAADLPERGKELKPDSQPQDRIT
jgi:hypothetical protein